jgi:tRNA pseudouridine55 synthase
MTKKSSELSGADNSYSGTVLFGVETDSQDMDGTVTAEHDTSFLTGEMVEKAFAEFAGVQQQIPPMVSAVKKDGKLLYALAREVREIEREPREITIHSIKVTDIRLPYADFELTCSKGTYVRTLCADIGKEFECGGVLYSLRRTASGDFSIEDAHTVESVKEWSQDDLLEGLYDFRKFF